MSKSQSAGSLRTRIQTIDPYEFEDFVAEVWEAEGWDTTVSKRSNDMGVDIIAEKTGTIDQKIAIQTKRYSEGNKVERPEMQQYHSLKEQDTHVDAAVVVTSSSFTSRAELWAMKNNVKIVDGDNLVERIVTHGLTSLVDDYADDSGDGSEKEHKAKKTNTSPPKKKRDSNEGPKPVEELVKTPFGLTSIAFVVQIASIWKMFDPSVLTFLSSGVAAGLFLITWFTLPIAIYLDANEQHQKKADYRPNRLIWPFVSFMLFVVGPFVYLYMRTSK